MTNPKGTFAESLLVKWARKNGFPQADRIPRSGAKDRGDVGLAPGVIVEVKNYALKTGFPTDAQLTKWLAETEAEIRNAGAELGYLVVKRKGTQDVGKWFCFRFYGAAGWSMTTVAQQFEVLRRAGYGDPIDEEV